MMIDTRIEEYAFRHTGAETPGLAALARKTQLDKRGAEMLTGRVQGRLLKLLVQMSRPALVVDVGTFTGYSALAMAEGLAAKGRIITCEVDAAARDIAQAAFDESPVGNRIELRFGPALDTLRALEEPIDFSFIDADKRNYPHYYEEILRRTRSGGIIVLDNMLWYGKVLDPQDEETRILHALNESIASDDRIENVLLTVRDGVQLLVKR